MPRRRGRRSRQVVPYDFVATFSSSSKLVQLEDLKIDRNRAMRPVRVSVSAAITGQTQLPALVISLFDTKDDIVNVSRPVTVGVSPTRLSLSVPRTTDFGGYHDDKSSVMIFNLLNYYNGTVTITGTLWMQYVAHKVPSQVAIMCDVPPQ